MKKAAALRLLVLLVVLTVLGILGLRQGRVSLEGWGKQKIALSVPTEIVLERGTRLSEFSWDLVHAGLVTDALYFEYWVRIHSNYSKFQAGRYRFEGTVSPANISTVIQEGGIFEPIVLTVSIPEGFTVKDIVKRLIKLEVGSAEELVALVEDPEFRAELKIPSTSLEGYLYPATYTFTKKPSPREILKIMVDTFWEKLPDGYEKDLEAVGLTLNEAVAFGSLIELETPVDEERELISEVIWTRLKRKMALGIDAAVIYGIPDFNGNLQKHHLEDRSNPYNSRVHRGLPPTAIGSPSRESLVAVLNPSSHGYLYFVLDLDTGKHHFSKTLKEHTKYVRKLIQDTRRR